MLIPSESGVMPGKPGKGYVFGSKSIDWSLKTGTVEKEEEEVFEPQPYKYEYGVQDDYSKAAFAKSESQNDVGAVTGSYKVR